MRPGVARVKVLKLGFEVEGEYFLDKEVPEMVKKYCGQYSFFRVVAGSHLASYNHIGDIKKYIYHCGGKLQR
jgi:hypothetical protein